MLTTAPPQLLGLLMGTEKTSYIKVTRESGSLREG